MAHGAIENEAREVQARKRKPRNVVTDPAPDIKPEMLKGVSPNGQVDGYEKGNVHKGTFYRECEGVHHYADEPFLRVVIYADEFHDIETRIPLKYLYAAGFRLAAAGVPSLPTASQSAKEDHRQASEINCSAPAIGAPIAGGIYAGVVLDKTGAPEHHLVLLSGDQDGLNWDKAVEWAAEMGGTLPNRSEQRLLYVNLKSKFKPEFYWSSEQRAAKSYYAWFQYFGQGSQHYTSKSIAGHARAVRRLPIQSLINFDFYQSTAPAAPKLGKQEGGDHG